MLPLVSVLIPAYNADRWIEETIQSVLHQTWQRTEIMIVDDGSRDRTLEIARRFSSGKVSVISIDHCGAAATRNYALRHCQGDYIQWLDADDLLAPDKIEKQLAALREGDDHRILLSCAWARFYYQPRTAACIHSSLHTTLSPVDWLLTKIGSNEFMQTATWLTSRELAEAAGPWDTRLLSDDDGEYYCRVLQAATQVRFVPGTGVFYRQRGRGSLAHIGSDNAKKDALLLSMKLHIDHLRSMEDSERVRAACLNFLNTGYPYFYLTRPDLALELQEIAASVGGDLERPKIRSKYAWIRTCFGWQTAHSVETFLPQLKESVLRQIDQLRYVMRRSHEPIGSWLDAAKPIDQN
jgi:glycosyltransferase involved in cell wall biosynthesis